MALLAKWTPLVIIKLRMSDVSVEIEAFATSRQRDELMAEGVFAMNKTVEALGEVIEGVDIVDKMDTIELLTYLVAGLGVIVLGLCIVVACLIIYQHCRKLKSGGYAPVHSEENGVIPNSYHVVQSPDKETEDQPPEVVVVDEVEKTKNKKESKKNPSVKVRLFTRQNSAKRKSKIEFDANDFDVPLPKVSHVKRVVFNPRISRSDWDIYDSRAGGEVREEIEMLLSRNSKDLSIRSKSPDKENDFKSQYFDAQETLSDDDDDDVLGEEKDEDYEDIEDEEEVKQKKERKRHNSSLNMKSQPSIVQQRVKALKKLLLQQKLIESELYQDIHKLEGLFYKQHRDQIYNNRRKHIEGPLSQPTIMEENEDDGDENEPQKISVEEQGIPKFWLRVLLNSKNLRQIVQATDIPVLDYLIDIRVFNFENPLGFRLAFIFKPNEYFADIELTKDYFLKCDPSEEDDPLHFEGPEVVGCQGCKIHWKKHQNLTIRPLKRVQNHKIVTKWARKNSFFNFFNPPKLRSIDDVHHLKRRELLEAHFELGLFFKEQVIPKAYLFFTRNGFDGIVQKSLGKRKLRLKSTSKANTPSVPKTPKRKLSDEPTPVQNFTTEEVVVEKPTSNGFHQPIEDINENIVKESNNENVIHSQVTSNDKTDILESISLPEKDVFPGRYLMESSEGFDDFMKALGVGMIKRRLANSVVPINEVEITEDGLYMIKTLTTVRNTELSFRLNETFTEDVIDGRKTQTTATRTGNLLVLDQKGDKTRGDKDSVMTREVEEDLMTMKLMVDNVTCVRIYKRMQE